MVSTRKCYIKSRMMEHFGIDCLKTEIKAVSLDLKAKLISTILQNFVEYW